MMNVKETLKRLHKRLPTLSLDELFELLDCYVEYDSNTYDWLNYKPNKVWYNYQVDCSDKSNCIKAEDFVSISSKLPKHTVKVDYSNDVNYYDNGSITTIRNHAKSDDIQLTADH